MNNCAGIGCSAFWRDERIWAEPLAGKSTLNQNGVGAGAKDRYTKITFWKEALDELLLTVFIESRAAAPQEIVLDVDTTDLPAYKFG